MRKYFGAFCGATSYEMFVWRFYITIPHRRYWRYRVRPIVGFDRTPTADIATLRYWIDANEPD